MKGRTCLFASTLLACSALAPLNTPASAQAVATPAVVNETTVLPLLTIVDGQLPQAPQGKLLTLTVDGQQVPLVPGTYHGRVVLSVTDDIPVSFHGQDPHHFRAALFVKDGKPVASRSVSAALDGPSALDGVVEAPRITSRGDRFNGIIVDGSGKYLINRPVIDFEGNGGNDFAGFGAALMATGQAEVTINRPMIRTHGAVRTSLFIGGNAVVNLNDAEIETFSGTLPADYKFTIEPGKMWEVPWMLGLSGNVRAVNLVGNGTLNVTNSHIRAHGWGALSTDDATHVRMNVKDSLIETIGSGYGSYSIGDSHNTFDHSIIRAADIGSIIAGEGSITFTNRTQVEAGRYGVMMHSGVGGGTLTIDKGSSLTSRLTAIEVKGRGTTIVIDDARVVAGNGVLVQAMPNDDPFMKMMMSGHAPDGMGAPPPGGMPGGAGVPGGDLPPLGMTNNGPPPSKDVAITLRNTALVGDIFNGRTSEGALSLQLNNATLTGTVSTSIVSPASGKEPTQATYQEIGNVMNAAGPTPSANGLALALNPRSRWVVTGKSYLTSLTIAPGAVIEGPGKSVRLTVNGKTVRLKPGKYNGAIVVAPE